MIYIKCNAVGCKFLLSHIPTRSIDDLKIWGKLHTRINGRNHQTYFINLERAAQAKTEQKNAQSR